LLEAGADIEAVNGRGMAALRVAAEYGHTELVYLLLEKGADFETRSTIPWLVGSVLYCLASKIELYDNRELFHHLLDKGADANTALLAAVSVGDVKAATTLLEAGADPEAVSKVKK
jgi:ankyrin repeat protein